MTNSSCLHNTQYATSCLRHIQYAMLQHKLLSIFTVYRNYNIHIAKVIAYHYIFHVLDLNIHASSIGIRHLGLQTLQLPCWQPAHACLTLICKHILKVETIMNYTITNEGATQAPKKLANIFYRLFLLQAPKINRLFKDLIDFLLLPTLPMNVCSNIKICPLLYFSKIFNFKEKIYNSKTFVRQLKCYQLWHLKRQTNNHIQGYP